MLVELRVRDLGVIRPWRTRRPGTRRGRRRVQPNTADLADLHRQAPGRPQARALARSPSSSEGCRFQARCPSAMERCKALPPLFRIDQYQTASCFLYDKQPQIVAERLSDLLPV